MRQARQWDLLYEEEDRFCGHWLSAGLRLLKACSDLPEEAASGRLSLANPQDTQPQAGVATRQEAEAHSSAPPPLPSELAQPLHNLYLKGEGDWIFALIAVCQDCLVLPIDHICHIGHVHICLRKPAVTLIVIAVESC